MSYSDNNRIFRSKDINIIKLQITRVNCCTKLDISNIHIKVLRDIFRQTFNFKFMKYLLQNSTFLNTDSRAMVPYGNFKLKHFTFNKSQKIEMDNTIGNRIKLNIFNNAFMLFVSFNHKGNKMCFGGKYERFYYLFKNINRNRLTILKVERTRNSFIIPQGIKSRFSDYFSFICI